MLPHRRLSTHLFVILAITVAGAFGSGCHGLISRHAHNKVAKQYEGGPPKFTDPVKQQYRARFLEDQKRYRALPAQVLPAANLGQPCHIDAQARERLLLGETIAYFERQFAASNSTVEYRNIEFTVLEGDCSSGVLSGHAKIAGAYEQVSTVSVPNKMVTKTAVQKVIEADFGDSQIAGAYVEYMRSDSTTYFATANGLVEAKSGDARTQQIKDSAMLSFIYGTKEGLELTGPNVSFSFQETGYVQTTNQRPDRAQRVPVDQLQRPADDRLDALQRQRVPRRAGHRGPHDGLGRQDPGATHLLGPWRAHQDTRLQRGLKMRHLPVRALFACMAVSAIALTACLAPPSPYTEQEQAALHSVFSQNARSFQQSVEAACTKARKLAGTVPEIAPQEGAPSSGTFPRTASGCFVGQTKWYTSPFDGTGLRVYDQGVYVEADTGMSPQEIFEGKFLFLSNRPEATGRGTYVMVGRRTRADGREQVGIFVAESVTSYLDLIPADKPYLDRIEQKHKQQVIAFREEQRRRAQSERSNFSFGQALALGLGGAAILSTGIPAEQMIEVGAAFTTDILTDGEAGALDELNGQYRTELENSRASHESEQRSSAAAGSGCGGYNDGGIHDGQAKSFCQSAYNYSCQGHDQGIQASCEMLLKLSETDHSKCSYCR